MATFVGYDLNFNLEQDAQGFRMKANGDRGNLRLHAFGDRFRFTSADQNFSLRLQIAIFQTMDRQWLPDNAVASIEGGEMDVDGPTFDNSSMYSMWELRDPMHARRVIAQKLAQLGISTGTEYRTAYANFIGHFVFTAARASYESLCKGVVVVIEVNQPRILDGAATSPFLQVVELGSVGEGVIREDCCAICWENFSAGIKVGVLACSHVHHEGCIREWLLRSPTCPICRSAAL